MDPFSPILHNAADQRSLRVLILQKAESIGPSVTTIVEGFWGRAVMGALYDIERFLKLAQIYSSTRLESASRRALFHGQGKYDTVNYILTNHLDNLPLSVKADIDGQFLLWTPKEQKTR